MASAAAESCALAWPAEDSSAKARTTEGREENFHSDIVSDPIDSGQPTHPASGGPAGLVFTALANEAVHPGRIDRKTRGAHLKWASIRNRRDNWVVITTTLQEASGSQIRIGLGVRPDAATFEISRSDGGTPPPSARDPLERRPECASRAGLSSTNRFW